MKSGKQLPLLRIFLGLIFGVVMSGCLRNLRDQIKTTVIIQDVPLDGQIHIKDDGWVEVKRLKALTDHDIHLSGIRFTRTDLIVRDAVGELAHPSALQWSVFRGALVVNGMIRDIVDFVQNEFYFNVSINLFAGQPSSISLDVRLLPIDRPVIIGFILSEYQFPGDAQVVYHDPDIGNELVVIHPALIKDSHE